MTLKETIQSDIKEHMKSRDKKRVAVLRMLLSEIQYAETASDSGGALDDAKILKVIATYEKRLVKALADYPAGGKAEEIKSEIGIVAHYLPEKISEKELTACIDDMLAKSDERNFGSLMKQVLSKFSASVDGKLVSRLLKERLAAA